jgi:DNA (cytosine-5)-methyltransferase 1
MCGAAFMMTAVDDDGTNLVLRRHRLFESNVLLHAPPCQCAFYRANGYRVAGVYGGGSTDKTYAREIRKGGYTPSKAKQQELIGCDHMTLHGLAQAIPPMYTQWLGVQLAAAVQHVAP